MARTYSQMVGLDQPAPNFDLPITNPNVDQLDAPDRALADYDSAELLVVVFTCNHCPYAVEIEDRLIRLAGDYRRRNVAFVAISSNDASQYPEDSFEEMGRRASEKNYPFPYLHDASQEVARAYGAECTPDIFVYDGQRRLKYRGRFDDGRPGMQPTTTDLKDALEELLETGSVTIEQVPSMGCNIKWKPAIRA